MDAFLQHFVVQMRRGGEARGADEADDLVLVDPRTDAEPACELRQVG